VKHLLVDEFQDTSRSQWLLLQNLCSGWQRDSGRTLFVVGDPNQSIYAFRKAKVSLFLEPKELLLIFFHDRFSLDCLQLCANFRSHPRLVDWHNQIFSQTIMGQADQEADEVVHVSAEALIEPGPEQLSLTLFSLENEGDDSRQAEARWLGQAVRRELEHLREGEKIGILLFTRTHLARYVEGLRRAGVAVQVQEGAPLVDQLEVLHLRQIAQALVRPHDDLAWAALLRAPWSRLTLDQLVQVAARPEVSWLEKMTAVAAELPMVKNVLETITRARRRLARDDLASLVENVWVELDGPAAMAGNGSLARVANCRSYLALLGRAEQGTPEETLSQADVLLRNAFAPPDPAAAPSPVELMTVHRAKGLEFDVVFLPFLDWDPLSGGRSSQPPYRLESIPTSGGEHLIAMAPDRRREKSGGLYRLLQDIGDKKKLAEAKRIFYVAVTRARRSLYLSGVCRTSNRKLSPPKNTPLWWLHTHHGLRLSENLELVAEKSDNVDLYFNPALTAAIAAEQGEVGELPEPLPFAPEPLPYRTVVPSQLTKHTETAVEHEEESNRKARGTVTHRLLERLVKDLPLPGSAAVAAALIREGVSEAKCKSLTEEILHEVQKCVHEDFFSWLISNDHAEAYCEWSLEDHPAPGQIRTGIVDRLVFDGVHWWVVDYKTGRLLSGESVDGFIAREAQRYHPQLQAYREMVANYFKVELSSVRTVLYFTALQRKVEVEYNP
jgi:ATP-dependent exoDNAse (exonuclease V) beta subunit